MKNYPKLETPYQRQRNRKRFILTNELLPDYIWFIKEEVDAIEKIDGTNVGIKIIDGKIVEAQNRETKVELGSGKGFDKFITEGILEAQKRGWLKDGIHYGELIGKNINQNRHQLQYHLWVPFDWLRENCKFEDYPREFNELREWFKTIPSLFNRKMGLPEILSEGIVFYRKKTGARLKIRRDMFDWYEGQQHKEIDSESTNININTTLTDNLQIEKYF